MEWIWHSHIKHYLWYKYTRQGILASLVSSPQSAKAQIRDIGNKQFFSEGCRHFPSFGFSLIPCSRKNLPKHEQGFWNSAGDCLALRPGHRSPPFSFASVSLLFKTDLQLIRELLLAPAMHCSGKRPVRCCEMGGIQLLEERADLHHHENTEHRPAFEGKVK